MELKININPTAKQWEVYQALRNPLINTIFFGGGAGGGKSWLICESRLVNCYQYPGYRSFIGREELKRLMQSTYVTWTKMCQYHKIPASDWRLNGQYNYIEFYNGSRIDLLDLKFLPSDPLYERFGSIEYTDGAIEEAGEVDFLAYDVLKSRIGRHLKEVLRPTMLISGNPKKNWTYQYFYKPYKEDRLPKSTVFIQALYKDNPYTAEEYGKQLAQISDKVMKQRLMLGMWEYEDNQTALVSYDSIVDLFTNTVEKSEQKFATVDVARYGQDKTVAMLWQGLQVYKIIVWEKQGLDVTAEKLKNLLATEHIPYSHAIVDEDGIGGGVVDILRGVKGFVANSIPVLKGVTTQKENFKNLKAQCGYKLAECITKHQIGINTEDEKLKALITEDLEQLRQKDVDKENKLQLMPKEDVKEILGRSPDFSDCLLMRMWFVVNKIGLQFISSEDRLFYEKMQAFKKKKSGFDANQAIAGSI